MAETLDDLIAGVRGRRVPALARAITMVENEAPEVDRVLAALYPDTGRAHRIGVTGPPGAGKSTLTERVVQTYRDRGLTVAVIAVDPTSPYSGGALLGDRIRMESVTMDDGVFIRSMASRGEHGGLATATHEACDVLDAAGFDRIVVETVGVGQAELAVVGATDTTVLVLVPEAGDGVQVLKAGLMEAADCFAVNKSDREGAVRLAGEIRDMIDLRAPDGWTPPVVETTATDGTGVAALVDAIERHATFLDEAGVLRERRRERLRQHTRQVVERTLRQRLWGDAARVAALDAAVDEVLEGTASPQEVAARLLDGGASP